MAHKLREVRIACGFSVHDLAELSGISVTTIRRVEYGNTFKVHEETARAIANALALPLTELFDLGELSLLGRTPKTGVPLTLKPTARCEIVCPWCHLVVISAPRCNQCEGSLPTL